MDLGAVNRNSVFADRRLDRRGSRYQSPGHRRSCFVRAWTEAADSGEL